MCISKSLKSVGMSLFYFTRMDMCINLTYKRYFFLKVVSTYNFRKKNMKKKKYSLSVDVVKFYVMKTVLGIACKIMAF